MADANLMTLSLVEEVTYGVSPSAAHEKIRMTGEDLALNESRTQSAEIRDDRQVADSVRTNLSAGGSINVEWSYGAFDTLLQGALYSTWTSENSNSISVTVVTGANTVTRGAGDFIADGYAVGDWVRFEGSGAGANRNIVGKITTLTTTVMTLGQVSSTLTNIGPVSMDIVGGSKLENGVTLKSYTIEREYTDLTSKFAVFAGMVVDSWTLSISPEAIVTGAFGFVGKNETSPGATTSNGTKNEAASNDVLNAIANVRVVLENGTSVELTEFSFDIQNNARTRLVIGVLGAASIGTGSIGVTGTLQFFYEDATDALFSKYLNDTETSFAVIFDDQDGTGETNVYVIEFPRAKLSSGSRAAGGINTDIIGDMTFAAIRDATIGKTVRVFRFPAS